MDIISLDAVSLVYAVPVQKGQEFPQQVELMLPISQSFYSSLLSGHINTPDIKRIPITIMNAILNSAANFIKILPANAAAAQICTKFINVLDKISLLPLLKNTIIYPLSIIKYYIRLMKRVSIIKIMEIEVQCD